MESTSIYTAFWAFHRFGMSRREGCLLSPWQLALRPHCWLLEKSGTVAAKPDLSGCCSDLLPRLMSPGIPGLSSQLHSLNVLSDDCIPNPCMNGGTCSEEEYRISCICLPGYGGDICETGESRRAPQTQPERLLYFEETEQTHSPLRLLIVLFQGSSWDRTQILQL